MSTTAKLRRIQNEIAALQHKSYEYDKMFKINMVDDNTHHWNVVLYGPQDSLYEGYEFQLDVSLSDGYPFEAPRVKFITPIQHVNINQQGDICLDILKGSWSPSQNITSVLISIISLLSQPNTSDPLNHDLGKLYKEDPKKYIEQIKTFCQKKCKKIS